MATISIENTQEKARQLLNSRIESVTALVQARQRIADLKEQLAEAEREDKRATSARPATAGAKKNSKNSGWRMQPPNAANGPPYSRLKPCPHRLWKQPAIPPELRDGKLRQAVAPRPHGHGKSYFLRAFPAPMWTTGPSGPPAHSHHGTTGTSSRWAGGGRAQPLTARGRGRSAFPRPKTQRCRVPTGTARFPTAGRHTTFGLTGT